MSRLSILGATQLFRSFKSSSVRFRAEGIREAKRDQR